MSSQDDDVWRATGFFQQQWVTLQGLLNNVNIPPGPFVSGQNEANDHEPITISNNSIVKKPKTFLSPTAPSQSTKRNNPVKRAPATTTAAPTTKKSVPATAANRTPIATDTKRNAADTAKQGTTANGKAAKDDNAVVDGDEGDYMTEKKGVVKRLWGRIKTFTA